MEEKVILVDKNDNTIGTMSKLDAHKQGKLHRALSVFIFNDNYEFLLQKREGKSNLLIETINGDA